MKDWLIELSVNGWEYSVYINISAKLVEIIGSDVIMADGVIMEFGSEIRFADYGC